MNILIIGGAGFLGANLVRRCLPSRTCRSRCWIRSIPTCTPPPAPAEVWPRIRFVRGDMGDEHAARRVVQEPGRHLQLRRADLPSALASSTRSSMPRSTAWATCKLLESRAPAQPHGRDRLHLEQHGHRQGPDGDGRRKPRRAAPGHLLGQQGGGGKVLPHLPHRPRSARRWCCASPTCTAPTEGLSRVRLHQLLHPPGWNDEEIRIFGTGEQTRNVLYVEDAAEILVRRRRNPRLVGEVVLRRARRAPDGREIARRSWRFGRGRLSHVEWPDCAGASRSTTSGSPRSGCAAHGLAAAVQLRGGAGKDEGDPPGPGVNTR